MNIIDILLLLPIIYTAWNGFKKGLVIEIFTLLALLVGIYAGIHFSDWTSQQIIEHLDWEGNYLPVVAFTLTFIGVGAMVYFLGVALEKMIKVVQLSLLNKFLGMFVGIIKALYILSIVITLLETYDERGQFIPTAYKTESLLYYPLQNLASKTIPAIEESTIWLKNTVNSSFFEEQKNNLEEFGKWKEKADSLGISVEDLKNLEESMNK